MTVTTEPSDGAAPHMHSSAAAAVAETAQPSIPRPTPSGQVHDVAMVRWPDEAERRAELAAAGRPCLLVVGPDDQAPEVSLLEDWVREPLHPDEVSARQAGLAARQLCAERPRLDDGLVLFRGGWAAVPPAQIRMAELLVERFGRVVRKDELAEAAWDAGGSAHAQAVKAALIRLGHRLAPLGLELRSLRGRGYLLQASGPCRLHGSESAPESSP